MIFKKIIVVCCIALVSACSTNNNADQVEAENQESASAASNTGDLRCKNVTVTGSRFPVKRCTTAAQRARELEDAKKVLNDARNNVGAQGS